MQKNQQFEIYSNIHFYLLGEGADLSKITKWLIFIFIQLIVLYPNTPSYRIEGLLGRNSK